MKYHNLVDCQESYIFPRDYIFPKCAALWENIVPRENITILAPPTHDISTVLVNICYTQNDIYVQNEWFRQNIYIFFNSCLKVFFLCCLSKYSNLKIKPVRIFVSKYLNLTIQNNLKWGFGFIQTCILCFKWTFCFKWTLFMEIHT